MVQSESAANEIPATFENRMGAYFSVGTAKTPPLFAAARVGTTAPQITLRSGKRMAKAFAASYEGAQRESVARCFTLAIIESYWTQIQAGSQRPFPLPEFFAPEKSTTLPERASAIAHSMGRAASILEPLAAAYLVSVTYTAMLPDETRSRLGAYYTPPPLAERLVSMATRAGVDWQTCRVLDPACGGGAFLAAVAGPLANTATRISPEKFIFEIASRLTGFEIDPFAAWLSQVFLEASLLPWCHRINHRLPVVVQVCNSLEAQEPIEPGAHYDLVIGNPPYGRVSLKPHLRARYSRSLYGHANLYGVFTDLAVRFARVGGVIAYVTPTSFLAGEYFKSLRSLLAGSAPPINIDFISVRKGVFDDALQETMLATYRKTNACRHSPTVHFVAPTDEDELTVEHGGKFDLPEGGGLWLVPRRIEQPRLVEKLRKLPYRLSDYGYQVSTGPLVWNRHKDQLAEKPGKSKLPLIWAEAVTSDGHFQFRADKKNHCPYFKILAGDDWLITRKPCVLVQRTTAKEQSRRLIATELPAVFVRRHGAVVIENHLNMIRPSSEAPAVSAQIMAAVLNTSIVDRAFRCISGSVAVSAYELENLPLPAPEELKQLLGRAVSQTAVAKACLRLYTEE
jgi:adenine-specific DNA-methyltransferase